MARGPIFQDAHVPEVEKVRITSINMSGATKLWWRTQLEDKSLAEIHT